MGQNKYKPVIRFKDFNDTWEQRKLDDLGKATGGTSIESEFSNEGKYKVISIGSYSESSTYNDQLIRAKTSKKTMDRILNKGDLTIILNDKTSSGRIIGRALLIEESNIYVYNQRTERLEPYKDKFCSSFLYQLLNAPNNREKIIKSSQGNTQIYVNWAKIKELNYMLPNFNEQRKLALFFTSIDSLITLHQREYEKFIKVKKSLLKKMFPTEGEKVPSIRFRGFTNAWEQRKFGDIFDYERPEAYIVKSDKYSDDNKTPVLTANKGFILGYTNETNTYKKPCVIFDDFTLDSKYVFFDFMVKSSAMKILTVKNGYDLFFAYNRLNSEKIESLGHARHYISIVQPIITNIPNIGEQKKIAEMMFDLDNLITLHQRKCEMLKNIKKALLEKMFC